MSSTRSWGEGLIPVYVSLFGDLRDTQRYSGMSYQNSRRNFIFFEKGQWWTAYPEKHTEWASEVGPTGKARPLSTPEIEYHGIHLERMAASLLLANSQQRVLNVRFGDRAWPLLLPSFFTHDRAEFIVVGDFPST
jgi:hypothetical protein